MKAPRYVPVWTEALAAVRSRAFWKAEAARHPARSPARRCALANVRHCEARVIVQAANAEHGDSLGVIA